MIQNPAGPADECLVWPTIPILLILLQMGLQDKFHDG